MDNSIEGRVNQIVAEQLGCSLNEVKPETKFMDDLGADSLDRVELVMALEDEFDLVIEDAVGETFLTPQVVYDYVKANAKVPA